MFYLFDTTILCGYFRSQPKASEYIDKIANGDIKASISSVTIAELYSGIGRDNTDRIDKTEALISFFQIEDLTEEIAKESGKLYFVYHHRMGQSNPQDKGPLFDAVIAATAKIKNLKLLTHNYHHFKPLEEDGHISLETCSENHTERS